MSRLNMHHAMLHQEAWATGQQLDELRSLAHVASGSALGRALAKLGHIVEARAVWLHRLAPDRYAAPEDLWPTDWTFDELEQEAARVQRDWEEWLGGVSDEAELDRVVEYTTTTGQSMKNTVEDIMLHGWSHGFYHRGQVGMLINQLGGAPPVIDYIVRLRG